jgi:predicted lipid carrier protein YhbT
LTDVAAIIHRLHMQEGWRWGDYGVPEEADVEEVLRRLVSILEGKDDGATVEATRLMVAKHDGELGVYVKVGTVGDE